MSAALLSRPLRLLLVLATVLCAAAVATGSGATFASTSASPGQRFVSGTLLQSNSRAGSAVLTAAGLRPGGTAQGTVTITNGGTLAGVLRLSETAATNTFAAGSMAVRVTDVATGAVVFDGDVGTMGSRPLGTFAAGESRTFRFVATLSSAAPPADQGKAAGATYVWDSAPAPDAG